MSIAQRYDNLGAEMSDLVQGGLIGLLRGIEKFDSSKGFRISTYVYWWIRQGVSRALVDNSRTLRLHTHLHERLGLIRNAKLRLQEKGITPSIDRIAESLNMSQKKVRNATEAVSKMASPRTQRTISIESPRLPPTPKSPKIHRTTSMESPRILRTTSMDSPRLGELNDESIKLFLGSNIPEDGSRLIKEVDDLDDEAFDDDIVYVRDDCEGLLVVD